MATDPDSGQWLSVAAAARALGLSRQAIQNRIKRGSIEHRRDNMGNPIVRVTATPRQPVSGAIAATLVAGGATPEPSIDEILASVRRVIDAPDEPTTHPPNQPATPVETVPASVVADLAKAHQEALAASEARRITDLAERDRLHRETVAMLIERTDAAECRAEKCEQRLDQVLDALLASKRSWWSRIPEPWLRYSVAFVAFIGAGVLVKLLR